MPFRYNRKKVALTYSAPVDELHPWGDKELAFMALDYHFGTKGRTIEKYLVAEETHEDGRLHYHMYFELDRRIDTIDPRYFDVDEMHPNIGDKPGKQAWLKYITKDGNYITNFYEPKVSAYLQAINIGGDEGMELLRKAHPRDFVINYSKIKSFFVKAYEGERRVSWLHGPSGSGKSRWANDLGAKDVVYKNGFVNGYNGEKVVVFNEIDKMGMPLDVFLRLTDRYKCDANVKGAVMPWAAEHVIFTSTLPWDGVFVHEHATQIERRITEIIDSTTLTWD